MCFGLLHQMYRLQLCTKNSTLVSSVHNTLFHLVRNDLEKLGFLSAMRKCLHLAFLPYSPDTQRKWQIVVACRKCPVFVRYPSTFNVAVGLTASLISFPLVFSSVFQERPVLGNDIVLLYFHADDSLHGSSQIKTADLYVGLIRLTLVMTGVWSFLLNVDYSHYTKVCTLVQLLLIHIFLFLSLYSIF